MARRVSMATLLAGLVAAPEDVMLSGVSADSRSLRPGDLFLACGGNSVHGAAFIEQAVQAGATAVVMDPRGAPELGAFAVPVLELDDLSAQAGAIAAAFHGSPSHELDVIGVTGTNGKTTVTHLLAHALNGIAGRGNACGIIGTMGYGAGQARHDATHTTPDAPRLQALLREFRQQQADYAVLEASSHGLAQHRLDGVRFRGAVLTNVGRDHLDYHASMEQYVASKQRLFTFGELQLAVLNADDDHGVSWARQTSAKEVFLYSMSGGAGADEGFGDVAGFLRGGSASFDRHGSSMLITDGNDSVECATRLIGSCNLPHVLAAATTLRAMGFGLEQVASVLATAPPVPGRMELFSVAGTAPVVVDYAHNPDALEVVLKDLRQLASGRLWCVFGCGGDRDQGKRPLMGRIAARLADRVIVTSDNPRNEEPERICREVMSGVPSGFAADMIMDRGEAISHAIGSAGEDDIVLVAGKGHESTQNVAGRLLPCDDRAMVRQLLEAEA